MKDTQYAYTVAKIRAYENQLLDNAVIEQMITSDSLAEAERILSDNGWKSIDESKDYFLALKQEAENTWQLLTELSPNKSLFDFLIIKNDFHNLKAALKSFISDISPDSMYIMPCITDTAVITNAVQDRKFERLPEFLQEAANAAYENFTITMDGQMIDVIIDRYSMKKMLSLARKTESEFCVGLSKLMCLTYDIKIALRCARCSKSEEFLKMALCDFEDINSDELKKASSRGVPELCDYLSHTEYDYVAEYIENSNLAFEKWCDDVLIAYIDRARLKSFDIDPIIAYYIAREIEIKTVRIVLFCKSVGFAQEKIRERVRELYV